MSKRRPPLRDGARRQDVLCIPPSAGNPSQSQSPLPPPLSSFPPDNCSVPSPAQDAQEEALLQSGEVSPSSGGRCMACAMMPQHKLEPIYHSTGVACGAGNHSAICSCQLATLRHHDVRHSTNLQERVQNDKAVSQCPKCGYFLTASDREELKHEQVISCEYCRSIFQCVGFCKN
ncbi:hypothetical protein EXIGLDRAFT_724845 [Exidia glandulosa HHB12029]|uniref:Uncharacterized protein n=1 Tax=Exidia glandulosa HHB12029 TaxID=1314781 RepID=A0A165E9P2_EXIGL|nr:hypothetical protein EXIGLDRAFT_724845 [Exidia glandulosa HHB12029]